MRMFNSSSQNIYLGITFFFVLIVQLKAQDGPEEIVLAHNEARLEVGVGPLKWDGEVAEYALDYANKRKDDCAMQHSGGPYGENLALSTGSMTIIEAVELWVQQKYDYDYDSNTCAEGKVCGQYTQVVWRNTKKVGCAKVECNNNRGTFIICNYDPPGNSPGEKPYPQPISL